MISIIHFISAKRRLEEMDKTFAMLDGDVSSMMRAQREMTKFEKEYYYEKMQNLGFFVFIFLMLGFVCFTIYFLLTKAGVL